MLDAVVALLRLIQYGAASVLMGSALFLVYALPGTETAKPGWSRPLLLASALVVLLASLLGLVAQTALMAGSLAQGVDRDLLAAVVNTMDLGKATIVRAGFAAAGFLLLLFVRPSRWSLVLVAFTGVGAVATFPWMGHGAATAGPGRLVHLTADLLHGLAAAIWVGALVAFVLLLVPRPADARALALTHRALARFSGIGTLLVAVLVATGLVNSWFLVGPQNLADLWASDYGRLLSLKLAIFLGMLALAASNRFRLTPALGSNLAKGVPTEASIAALRRSIAFETALGLAVLALVAWFGMLEPPAAME